MVIAGSSPGWGGRHHAQSGRRTALRQVWDNGTGSYQVTVARSVAPVVAETEPTGPAAGTKPVEQRVRPGHDTTSTSSQWSNVRKLATREQWDRMRRQVYQAAGWRCELCGDRGPDHPVECHEVWAYDDTTAAQRLMRLQALCPACHEVKHYGYTRVRGREWHALTHLARVNGWPLEEARPCPGRVRAVARPQPTPLAARPQRPGPLPASSRGRRAAGTRWAGTRIGVAPRTPAAAMRVRRRRRARAAADAAGSPGRSAR